MTVQFSTMTLDGDHPGHSFRGNQHVSASGESRSAVRSSQKAKHAEKHGDPKTQKKAHKVAHHAHMAAAEEATTAITRKYHTTMAKFHGSRAGMMLDGVEGWDGISLDDASDFSRGNIVGKIMQGGKQMGRAVIVGDGKAMVFVGDSEDQRVHWTNPANGEVLKALWSDDDAADMVEWLLNPPVPAFKPSDKWVKVSAGEYRIDIPESTGYKGADGVTLKRKGQKWFDLGSGESFASLADAQKMIEDWFAREERTRAEEAASRAEVEAMSKAKAQEPAAPVEVYAFKDASDEAMGLLRIGAQNTATRSTYKTAVSVEQSADAHGMAIHWEAVDSLPTFDDATGGLFGDGDQGHIRGDLAYNGTKLAQVYVREDGMSAFEFELVMSEHIDADEEGWAGWHDAWTDVISKMRDVCDDNGIAQPEESPFGRLYEYEVTEDKEGGWWAKFKNDAMSEMRAWSQDKDEVIAKAEKAIELHKKSPYLDRRWNSLYGGVVKDVKLAGLPTMGEGSELYEVKYPDGSYRRFQARDMDRRIADDEYNATPEGIKAAQDASAKYQREAEARRAAEEAAKAENDRLDAKIREFTDSAGYSARDAGKAREVLKTSVNYGDFGGVMRRLEFLEKAVDAGFKTSTEQVKKIKDKTRLQFNRMDQREQDEFDAKQKAAGTKTEYQVGNYTVTKTEYDYANYLIGKTAATDPAPTPEPTVTPEPAPADTKTEDRAFFMSVIDGSHPEILEPELADKLAQAYERHAGDAEITSLFMQAGNAYTQAMLAATEGV